MAAQRSSRLQDLDCGPSPHLIAMEWSKTTQMMAIVPVHCYSVFDARKDWCVQFGGKERRGSGWIRRRNCELEHIATEEEKDVYEVSRGSEARCSEGQSSKLEGDCQNGIFRETLGFRHTYNWTHDCKSIKEEGAERLAQFN